MACIYATEEQTPETHSSGNSYSSGTTQYFEPQPDRENDFPHNRVWKAVQRKRVRKKCDDAGLPHCAAHGLRKAAAARLAELGAPENEIMAITGHRTSKEITRYTRGARQRLLAEHAFARHVPIDVSHLIKENQSGAQHEAADPEIIEELKVMVPRGGASGDPQTIS